MHWKIYWMKKPGKKNRMKDKELGIRNKGYHSLSRLYFDSVDL